MQITQSTPSPKTSTEKNKSKKTKWLSPTAVNAYQRCPRNYYYRYIKRLKQKPSIHLIRGIAVHNAIEKFYKHKLHRCADMDYGDLRGVVLDLFKDEWRNRKESLEQLGLKQDEIEFFYSDSQKMILNFLHWSLKNREFEKPAPLIEKTLFSKEHGLFGRIDAIYQEANSPLVVDYKTSRSAKLTDDYKRQLAIYALLHKTHFHKNPIVAIHFLRFKNGLRKYKISDKALEETAGLIKKLHDKTQSKDIDDYPCTCGWCEKNFKFENK